ncbi:MAG: hypothetical protein ACREMV_06510 [Gemmatimonadales bacterium]
MRRDVDPHKIAAFLGAAAEGSFGLSKSAGSRAVLRSNLEMLAMFLDSLRPAPGDARVHDVTATSRNLDCAS